ncbi:hypothetical protein ACLB2K_020538 [Fragaria x ananassa]
MVGISDNPVDPGTQVELQPGNTSLPQTSNPAHISHPDPATALELLKRDFHSLREQAAKEKAEVEAYRVRIAELEKEQFLLRATLEHRHVYNDRSDRAARIAGTTDSLQGQTGSMLPGGHSQIVYISHPLDHPSFPLPAPQPSPILSDSPLAHQPNPSTQPIPTSTKSLKMEKCKGTRDPYLHSETLFSQYSSTCHSDAIVQNGQLHQYCARGQILILHGGAPRFSQSQSSVTRHPQTSLTSNAVSRSPHQRGIK